MWLQQAADGWESALDKDQETTLSSKYSLGVTLYEQEKYSEAVVWLQQAVDGRERMYGRDHENTLFSKHWLGLALHEQGNHSEAEVWLQQAADGRERTFGRDHEHTLISKHWLGLALHKQEKYSEAAVWLQQAVYGWDKTLGGDDKHTLYSKYWLGLTLHKQKKYSEAEVWFQQAADGREKTLGKEHENTLNSKHWLGITLYYQRKYSKAALWLQQAADGWKRTVGRDHEYTLYSNHWLGLTLYKQEKYSEAAVWLQQAADGRERTFGKDHDHTLISKHWLGLALHKQEKYVKAKSSLQEIEDRRESTLEVLDSLQNLHLDSSLPAPAKNNTQQRLIDQLSRFFPVGEDRHTSYTDSEINEISSLLKHSHPQWSKMPRTYVVLRAIGQLSVFNDLINAGFSDYWFPVTERNLPEFLRPSVRTEFLASQQLILSKSMDLEKGQHCYYKQGESPPFETKEILGRGGFGQVDRVLSLISFKEYARKLVSRGPAFSGRRKEDIERFISEIEILKRLKKHRHIVEFIGSYTDAKYISLIMLPVAEMDLTAYLTRATISNHPQLRTYFGCLARALEFLHEQKVRHKDIKPGNILIHHGNVLLADFGLSLDFVDADGSTTISMVNGMTPKYCAPEVAQYEPRNTMSDIWSLGVVFMEMVAVLKGKTIRDITEFFSKHGSRKIHMCNNLAALPEFVSELEVVGKLSDNRALGWIQNMLSLEQHSRPTASSLVASITALSEEGESTGFCGICCDSPEEDFSDWVVGE